MQVERLCCLVCAQRLMGYPDDMDPDINTTYIEGTIVPRKEQAVSRVMDLKTGETLSETPVCDIYFACDQCGTPLHVGERAVAWTSWPMKGKKEEWESNMLTDFKLLKEIKR